MLKLINSLKWSVNRSIGAAVLMMATSLYAKAVYYYEPEVVTITGIVADKSFPGPPDFGENINNKKVTVPIVLLHDPIDILPVPNVEMNDPDNQEEKDVKFMQLFSDGKPVKIRGCAKLTGSFMHQVTAHHYTKVLMNVDLAEKSKECD